MEIETIGVIGAGVMGQGVSYQFAKYGYKIILLDINDEALESAKGNIKNIARLDLLLNKSVVPPGGNIAGNITYTMELNVCFSAGYLRDAKSPDAFIQTSVAKYFASRAANRIASDAAQLHGALGCHDELPIQRYFRDAKIMEIIEGSTEIQQLLIADYGISNLHSIIGD